MASTVYLEYTITLSNKVQVEALQGGAARWNSPRNSLSGSLLTQQLFGQPIGSPGQVYASPDRMLAEYPGAVIKRLGDSMEGVYPPFIQSPHLWAGANDARYPTNVDYFERCAGGLFGVCFLFGKKTKFIWVGTFKYAPAQEVVLPPGPPGGPETYRQLRWAEGFEHGSNGAGSAGGASSSLLSMACPAASRHLGGYGIAITEPTGIVIMKRLSDEYRTGLLPTSTWERVYIRIITLPSVPWLFWKLNSSSVTSGRGVSLGVTPTGQIAIYEWTSSTVKSLVGTSPIQATGEWLKLDFVCGFGTGAQAGLYINGVLVLSVASFGVGVAEAGVTHVSSELGATESTTTGGCLHFDDWSSHDAPLIVEHANQDFRTGTKIVRLIPTSYGADHNAVWDQPVEWVTSEPEVSLDPTMNKTTNNATGPKFSVLTDVIPKVNKDPRVLNGGVIGIMCGIKASMASGGTSGTFDYSVNGGAFVTVSTSFLTTLNWRNAAYVPSGLLAPLPLTSFALRWSPGASAHNRTISSIGASAVVCGVFGQEDIDPNANDPGVVEVPANNGEHNHPYPYSPWATSKLPVLSPVIITYGTYVGNGTTTRLTFPAPVTFFKSRRVTATIADSATWWTSMQAPAEGAQAEISTEHMLRATYALTDPAPVGEDDVADGTTTIVIVGNSARSNQSGTTYQYIAFMDPGARFSRAGSLRHDGGTTTRTTPLFDENFLPEAMLLAKQNLSVATASGLFYKGPGHTSGAVSLLTAAETATALDMALGLLTHKSALHNSAGASNRSINYLAWRDDDGSGDPGIPATIQLLSYIGDGTASRTISLRQSGVRPGFCIITPHNAASQFRDPSHLTTTSSLFAIGGALTAQTTGITGGGIDTINVGTTLNASGIVYDVFVIMGLVTAGNNGWSGNGTVSPVEPALPPCAGPDCIEPPEGCDEGEGPDCADCEGAECDEGGGGGGGGGGIEPPGGGGNDFGTQCVAASQKVCNQAISHIGISQSITDIVNDARVEADQCRLHYADAVNECLRDFPWAFATKYASLTLLDGSESDPVNHDWTYAYAVPSDCVFARRILNVKARAKRAFDEDPPQFRPGTTPITTLAVTTTTPVIFSDEADAELEYTYRAPCAAGSGDSLFRSALAWLMASKLAPSASRNKITAAEAYGFYQAIIQQAKLQAAREAQPNQDMSGDASWHRDRG